MVKNGFTITGIEQLENVAIKLKKKYSKEAIEAIMIEAREIIFNDIMLKMPVKTGNMKKNTTVTLSTTTRGWKIVVHVNTKYASAVEYGTIHIDVGDPHSPKFIKSGFHPFARPALLLGIKHIKQRLKQL